jgi:uroporphyrinogen-III synthase
MPDLAFCVGDQTAEKASAAGFRAVSAKGDARALVALVLASGVGGPILYLRAEEAREDLAALVSSGGIETDSLVAYTQGAQGLSPDGRQMLRGESPVILPLFSPRSAQILVSVMPSGPIAPLWVAAMSEAVALAATPLRAEKIFTAPHPDADSMIATVARLLAAAAGA